MAGIRRGYVNTCSGMFVVTVSHCAVSIFLFLVAILSPGLTASSEVKKKIHELKEQLNNFYKSDKQVN